MIVRINIFIRIKSIPRTYVFLIFLIYLMGLSIGRERRTGRDEKKIDKDNCDGNKTRYAKKDRHDARVGEKGGISPRNKRKKIK